MRKNFFLSLRCQFLSDTKMWFKNRNNCHGVIFCWNFAQLQARPQSIAECKTQMTLCIIKHSSSSPEELLRKNQEEVFHWAVGFFGLFGFGLFVCFQEGTISYLKKKKKLLFFPDFPKLWNETEAWLKVMWNLKVQLDNAILMSFLRGYSRGHFYRLVFFGFTLFFFFPNSFVIENDSRKSLCKA